MVSTTRLPPRRRATSVCVACRRADVATFFDRFAGTSKTVTLYSQGREPVERRVGQGQCADQLPSSDRPHWPARHGAVLHHGPTQCHGRTQKSAHLPTRSPHMEFAPADIARVGRFWRAAAHGDAAGSESGRPVRRGRARRDQAVWIMATNPVVSSAQCRQRARRTAALRCCRSCRRPCAPATVDACRIRLPALAWGEKDGTVTNSSAASHASGRSCRRPARRAPGRWIIAEVARRLGHGEAFAWRALPTSSRARRPVGLRERRGRDFDIGAKAGSAMLPTTDWRRSWWPARTSREAGSQEIGGLESAALFADGGFHADRRARFVAVTPAVAQHAPERCLADPPEYRLRDQWHTMTRTGRSVRLAGHRPELTRPASGRRPRPWRGRWRHRRGVERVGRAVLRLHDGNGVRRRSLRADALDGVTHGQVASTLQ